MEKIDAVINMQEYIETHLNESITLADLSRVSCYSPWYSYRLFIEFVKMTPSDYIRRLRLSKSALKLRDEATKIIDIAYEYGYLSVDGYQRAFYKEFGINPYEYSKNPTPISLFTPYKVGKRKEVSSMSEIKNVFITVVQKPKRKVIIKRGQKATEYFAYCNEVGCDVWGILTSIKSISGEPVCLWLPDKYIKENTSKYVQGVEVSLDYSGPIPEGFETIILEESTYLMFQGEPFKEEDYGEAIEAIWEAIDKFNPTSLGFTWDEENPRIQLEPVGERGYIELKAVKKSV
jgi:AraC-like DNA-binding protein